MINIFRSILGRTTNIYFYIGTPSKEIFRDRREYKWECGREVEHAGNAFDDSHPDADFHMMPTGRELVARAALVGSSSACALNTIASVRSATANVAVATPTLVARAALPGARAAYPDGVAWLGKCTLAAYGQICVLENRLRDDTSRNECTVLEAVSDIVLAVVPALALKETIRLKKACVSDNSSACPENELHTTRLSTPGVADARETAAARTMKLLTKYIMMMRWVGRLLYELRLEN